MNTGTGSADTDICMGEVETDDKRVVRMVNILDAAKSVTIILAILSGALWAVFVRDDFSREKKEQEEINLKLKKLEYELSRQAVVEIGIEASVQESGGVSRLSAGEHIVLITIKIANKGNKSTTIIPPEGGLLTIRKVNFSRDNIGKNGEIVVEKPLRNQLVLMHGMEMNLSFVVALSDRGVYLIEFEAEAKVGESSAPEGELPDYYRAVWLGEEHLIVN